MVWLMENTTMQLQWTGWNECNLTFAAVCHSVVRTGRGVCIHLQIEMWILAFFYCVYVIFKQKLKSDIMTKTSLRKVSAVIGCL